ncbi:hypothetical protein [Natronomonas marina]|jgi:hypothetical protein|uniref:hypothetical protein n=1 Tax=Natronomonas marina TaxID=2961939 RepID=UPI0020C94C6C|nr:hypothetical protein [Natronomonas marina]
MNRRHFVAAAAATSVAGCTGLFGSEQRSRLDLTVQNEGTEPIIVRVVVVDDDGTTYEDTSDRVEGGVARAFEVVGGTDGRHEATVTGDDWEGQVAWDAGTCALFDGRVRLTDGSVEVASECVDFR